MWQFVLTLWLLQVRGEVNLPADTEPPRITSGSLITDDSAPNSTPRTISEVNGNNTSPIPPQTLDLRSIVTSGPIVLVDKKTLFIPAFRYKGDHKNVNFWVGNGTKPNSKGRAIPDEQGSLKSLHSYDGQNLYLHLPDGVTTDNIDYFSVWSKDENTDLGHVNVSNVRNDVPEVETLVASDKFIIRVPKCCSIDAVVSTEGCEASPVQIFDPKFKVYQHNETHFDNDSLDLTTIRFIPYIYSMKCAEGKVPLNKSQDEFAILMNGSLLLRAARLSGIYSQQDFCLETIKDDNFMSIFVCIPEHKIQQAMFVTYVTLTLISTFCFAGTFFIYIFWLKIEDIHRKCFTAYVFAMTMTFFSLTIVQLAYIEDGGCSVLGFLFQFSMIASFTLLAILCFDIYIIVKEIDKNTMKKRRKWWYIGIAVAVPTLFLIISLARKTPDVPNSFFKPQYRKNSCSFPEDQQRSILFYLPILASVIVGVVFLVLTKLRIVDYEKTRHTNALWIDNKQNFKFMLRKYFIVGAVSCLWPVEIMLQLYAPPTGILIAFEIIEASQGMIVFLLFVLNKETRKSVLKRFKARRMHMEYNNSKHEEICMMNASEFGR